MSSASALAAFVAAACTGGGLGGGWRRGEWLGERLEPVQPERPGKGRVRGCSWVGSGFGRCGGLGSGLASGLGIGVVPLGSGLASGLGIGVIPLRSGLASGLGGETPLAQMLYGIMERHHLCPSAGCPSS
eukprot:scaffold17768_cov31-Tisochrysis_lutea.AAC.5